MDSMPPSAASAGVTLEWPNVSSCQCWRTMYPKVLASHLNHIQHEVNSHPALLHHGSPAVTGARSMLHLWPRVI
jgi:hypothetical protein